MTEVVLLEGKRYWFLVNRDVGGVRACFQSYGHNGGTVYEPASWEKPAKDSSDLNLRLSKLELIRDYSGV